MKKTICLVIVLHLLLCGCSNNRSKFTENKNGNIVSNSGVEYSLLANDGILCFLGETEFLGRVQGDKSFFMHLTSIYRTGMFSIKNAENDNILIRCRPNNEWLAIYRKTSLPAFDFSVDNCIRFEFISGIGNRSEDVIHTTCNAGITDQKEITAFLSDVRAQQNPREAGLYDMITNPNGTLNNCYVYGVIYGFFAEEPNLVQRMYVNSFNDLAYSVVIEEHEYVLPEEWIEKLQGHS